MGHLPYSYDGNGNQTTGASSASFTWDPLSRLSGMSSGGSSYSMASNGDGLRGSRATGGTTTNYTWDQAGGLPQIIDDGTGQYVPGLGAGGLGQITTGGTYYFLPDALGSTVAIVDSSGTVKQTYTYDAFGKATVGTNNHPTEFQFGGQQTDPSGMQALRARYNDPNTGRLLSRM